MDEQTKIFIALGAATAANCDPCFEHYFSKAEKLGIDKESVKKAVAIAVKVRGGAHMVMKESIQRILTNKTTQPQTNCNCDSSSDCCG